MKEKLNNWHKKKKKHWRRIKNFARKNYKKIDGEKLLYISMDAQKNVSLSTIANREWEKALDLSPAIKSDNKFQLLQFFSRNVAK